MAKGKITIEIKAVEIKEVKSLINVLKDNFDQLPEPVIEALKKLVNDDRHISTALPD